MNGAMAYSDMHIGNSIALSIGRSSIIMAWVVSQPVISLIYTTLASCHNLISIADKHRKEVPPFYVAKKPTQIDCHDATTLDKQWCQHEKKKLYAPRVTSSFFVVFHSWLSSTPYFDFDKPGSSSISVLWTAFGSSIGIAGLVPAGIGQWVRVELAQEWSQFIVQHLFSIKYNMSICMFLYLSVWVGVWWTLW